MKLFLFLFSCVLVLAQIHESRSCFTVERAALLNIKAFLYNQTDHYGHKLAPIADHPLSSWIHDPCSDCCGWKRVTCNPFSGHVTDLYLQDLQILALNFNFTIDFSLFQAFKELRLLNLSYGYFNSLIHAEVLANLSNLEVLIMSHNYFTQPLPVQGLCELKKIRVLDLAKNHFKGPLPKCFGNLTSLQGLHLSGNYLSGEIPSVIASFASLEFLYLDYNEFEGLFPLSSFANNSHLKVLALGKSRNNKMLQVETEGVGDVPWVPSFQLEFLYIRNCKLNAPKGVLPSFLLYQHELQYLDLSFNNLVGQFPNWLFVNNTKLKHLGLCSNYFTGSFVLQQDRDQHPHLLNFLNLANNRIAGKLPQDIGHIFPNLVYLYLSYNELYGTIPTSIGSMSRLIVLHLRKNNLFGEVPKILWTGCASLRQLALSDNSLRGQLFPSSLNLSNLEYLFLDNNYFSGPLQHGMLPSIQILDISNNNLWGTIPPFIGDLSTLQVINLSGNNFSGALPIEICKLELLVVHLSDNKLSGSIPPCYLNLPYLTTLYLQNNSLVGSIPNLMITSSSLRSLNLRDNNLSGEISSWVSDKVRNLTALLLGGNQLQGQLPNSLCQLEKINFLDLSRNKFTGSIPTCFSNISFGGSKGIFLDEDYVWGRLPEVYQYRPLNLMIRLRIRLFNLVATSSAIEVEFRTKGSFLAYEGKIRAYMSGLDFSCNELTGLIPREMGYLVFLHALNLSHNHLIGSIPDSFHNLEDIESLDLSHNNLSGKIPPQLQDLHSLGVFNVSYNNLSGTCLIRDNLEALMRAASTATHIYFGTIAIEAPQNSHRQHSSDGKEPPPTTDSSDGKDDDSIIDFTIFYWSFVASYVTILLLFGTILWINPQWRRVWFYFIKTCLFKCFHCILKDAFY